MRIPAPLRVLAAALLASLVLAPAGRAFQAWRAHDAALRGMRDRVSVLPCLRDAPLLREELRVGLLAEGGSECAFEVVQVRCTTAACAKAFVEGVSDDVGAFCGSGAPGGRGRYVPVIVERPGGEGDCREAIVLRATDFTRDSGGDPRCWW